MRGIPDEIARLQCAQDVAHKVRDVRDGIRRKLRRKDMASTRAAAKTSS